MGTESEYRDFICRIGHNEYSSRENIGEEISMLMIGAKFYNESDNELFEIKDIIDNSVRMEVVSEQIFRNVVRGENEERFIDEKLVTLNNPSEERNDLLDFYNSYYPKVKEKSFEEGSNIITKIKLTFHDMTNNEEFYLIWDINEDEEDEENKTSYKITELLVKQPPPNISSTGEEIPAQEVRTNFNFTISIEPIENDDNDIVNYSLKINNKDIDDNTEFYKKGTVYNKLETYKEIDYLIKGDIDSIDNSKIANSNLLKFKDAFRSKNYGELEKEEAESIFKDIPLVLLLNTEIHLINTEYFNTSVEMELSESNSGEFIGLNYRYSSFKASLENNLPPMFINIRLESDGNINNITNYTTLNDALYFLLSSDIIKRSKKLESFKFGSHIGVLNDVFLDTYVIKETSMNLILNKFNNIEILNNKIKLYLPEGKSKIDNIKISNCETHIPHITQIETNNIVLNDLKIYKNKNCKQGNLIIDSLGEIKLISISFLDDVLLAMSSNLPEEETKVSIIDTRVNFESELEAKALIHLENFSKISLIELTVEGNFPNRSLLNIYNTKEISILGLIDNSKTRNKHSLIFENCSKVKINDGESNCISSNSELIKYIGATDMPTELNISAFNISNVLSDILLLYTDIGKLYFDNFRLNKSVGGLIKLGFNDILINDLKLNDCLINLTNSLNINTTKSTFLNTIIRIVAGCEIEHTSRETILTGCTFSTFSKLKFNTYSKNGKIVSTNSVFNNDSELVFDRKKERYDEPNNTSLSLNGSTFTSIDNITSIRNIKKIDFNEFKINSNSFEFINVYMKSGIINYKTDANKKVTFKDSTIEKIILMTEFSETNPDNIIFDNTIGQMTIKENLMMLSDRRAYRDILFKDSNITVTTVSSVGFMSYNILVNNSQGGLFGQKTDKYDFAIILDGESESILNCITVESKIKKIPNGLKDFDKSYIGKVYKEFIYGLLPDERKVFNTKRGVTNNE